MPDPEAEALDGAGGTAPTLPAAVEKPFPSAADLHVEKPAPVSERRTIQRNPILGEIVQGEDDLAGLIGYALYKLNKRDWLASFFKAHGREPTEGEVESYVLGERTQRRIATYRRLGEDLVRRKADIAEKAATATAATVTPAAAAPSPLQRVSAMKSASLKSALTPGSPVSGGPQPRSAKAALLFWIAVLIVLAATGYYYVNYSSLFLGR